MSRIKNYLERTTPLLSEQLKKFWRSEYLYANVENTKGYSLGRIAIELNTKDATMTSRNLRISWLTTGTAALEFNKENLKGYSAIRMRLVGEDTSSNTLLENELHSKSISDSDNITPKYGDIIKVDSSNSLYIIGNYGQTYKSQESNKGDSGKENTINNIVHEENLDCSGNLFDYIKVGNISNANGFAIFEELDKSSQEKIQVVYKGSYKKLYIMKIVKFYIFVSIFGFYIVHFTGYKGKITIPTQELHDLALKHH